MSEASSHHRFALGHHVHWRVWPHAVYQVVWQLVYADGQRDYGLLPASATGPLHQHILYTADEADIAALEDPA